MGNHITFVVGGARSGKSSYALNEANLREGKKAFIATAEALDHEMEIRIARHKEERGDDWVAFEEPLKIDIALQAARNGYSAVIVDCLTLWVSNLLHAGYDMNATFQSLEATLLSCQASHIYIVSNEVGMGIVPGDSLSRIYRDRLGEINRMMARVAGKVVLMVAGIPLEIKKAP
jgi:adenosylcobinamide kinase / adenosylcobinamide-phosphate guanylyltransferase